MPNKDSNNSNREKKRNSQKKKDDLIYSSKHIRNKENYSNTKKKDKINNLKN